MESITAINKVSVLTAEKTQDKISKFLAFADKKTNRINKEFSEGFNYVVALEQENLFNSDCKETPKVKVLVNSEKAKEEINETFNLDFSEIEQ
jgi:hypothetical protein